MIGDALREPAGAAARFEKPETQDLPQPAGWVFVPLHLFGL